MQRIEVRFEPEDIQRLDQQAAALKMTRAELVRSRALATPKGSTRAYTATEYNQLVAAAHRFTHGDLDRRHVETLVGFVFTRLHELESAAS
jgi:hypothetical protein